MVETTMTTGGSTNDVPGDSAGVRAPRGDAPRRTAGFVVAGGVVAGLIGTAPIGRLTGWKRAAYCFVEAPLFAFAVSRLPETSVRQRVALTGLTAGAAALGKSVSVAVDRRLEASLVERGVRHPRVVIGVVSGVVGAIWVAASGGPERDDDRRSDAGASMGDGSESDAVRARPDDDAAPGNDAVTSR